MPALSNTDIRPLFPIFSKTSTAILDNAAGSQLPQCVIDAAVDYINTHQYLNTGMATPESIRVSTTLGPHRSTVRTFRERGRDRLGRLGRLQHVQLLPDRKRVRGRDGVHEGGHPRDGRTAAGRDRDEPAAPQPGRRLDRGPRGEHQPVDEAGEAQALTSSSGPPKRTVTAITARW